MGSCSTFMAETWGIFHALTIAQRMKLTNVVIESDSQALVNSLQSTEVSNTKPSLMRRIKGLLSRDWNVKIIANFREANQCVDWLANHSLNYGLGLHILSAVDPQLRNLILGNAIRVSSSRVICS